MKSIVIHAARDLRIEDRPEETPGPGEVKIALAAGGICGSDLHYFHNGGFGDVRLKEPMILGHEVSGHIAALGAGVTGLREGQLVAISPSRPCGATPEARQCRIHPARVRELYIPRNYCLLKRDKPIYRVC